MEDYYSIFNRLRKVKISPKTIYNDYGNQAAFRLNYLCPIVVKKGGMELDELASEMNISADELYQLITDYKPKYLAICWDNLEKEE